MPHRPSRRITTSFAVGLFLIVAAIACVGVSVLKYESDGAWVAHTLATRETLDQLVIQLQDVRDTPATAGPQVARTFAEVRSLMRDNPAQQQRLARLAPLVEAPAAHLPAIRAGIAAIRDEETALQQKRLARARRSLDLMYAGAGLGLIFALALFLAAWSRLSLHMASQAEALRRLKQSEAQAAALLDNGTDVVWAVDEALRVRGSNKRFRKLLEQIVGFDVDEEIRGGHVSLADFEPWHDAYRRALAGDHVTLESMQEIKGRMRYFLISFGPIIVDGEVTGAAAFAKDITTRKRAEAKLMQRAETLYYLSVVDPLTQLHNRRGFLELGGVLLREAREQGQPVQLLFADLDGLKQLNDRFGHAAGDEAIRKAGEVLHDSVRRSDVVARLGGDEFVVLAAGSDHDDSLIERIQRRAAAASVQLSLGVVRADPEDEPCTLEQLIERADALMYEHKQARRRPAPRQLAATAPL